VAVARAVAALGDVGHLSAADLAVLLEETLVGVCRADLKTKAPAAAREASRAHAGARRAAARAKAGDVGVVESLRTEKAALRREERRLLREGGGASLKAARAKHREIVRLHHAVKRQVEEGARSASAEEARAQFNKDRYAAAREAVKGKAPVGEPTCSPEDMAKYLRKSWSDDKHNMSYDSPPPGWKPLPEPRVPFNIRPFSAKDVGDALQRKTKASAPSPLDNLGSSEKREVCSEVLASARKCSRSKSKGGIASARERSRALCCERSVALARAPERLLVEYLRAISSAREHS
jgi:hypothetical protein